MSKEPIRVLHIVTYMARAGLETLIMNYYRNIDREKLQFDFLVHRDFRADYDDEIERLGGKIYRLPRLNPFDRSYLNKLDNFFAEHKEYKIVHSHLDCMAGIPLKYAKKNGVPVRIAHSHSSNQTKDFKYLLKLIYKHKIGVYSTDLFACSKKAGEWMFCGSPFTIFNNSIDASKYIFNIEKRQVVRKNLEINKSAVVLGHVGRFSSVKNHNFLIDIFEEYHKTNSNSYLLLVGTGELEQEIKEKVISLNLENKVIFAGVRADINELLQAMDIFCLPSLYEGLPVTIVEAQTAGLPCLISNKVPIECKKTDLVKQIPLNSGVDKWVKSIEDSLKIPRRNTYEEIKASGFDIVESAKKLEEFYIGKYNEK